MEYTAVGDLWKRTAQRGLMTTRGYDAFNRLVVVNYPDVKPSPVENSVTSRAIWWTGGLATTTS